MSNPVAVKPDVSEYGSYFGRYITLVADADIVAVLEDQLKTTRALLDSISEEKANHRYEAGKWSIKELVGHIADAERIFAYRALRFARNDKTELPGFDQDTFAASANFANLSLSAIIQEYEAVRRATILLLKNLGNDAWSRRGKANNTELTVRAIAFTIAGHELHHLGILKSRYL
jgi:uncharacterized damage-inducible protein DinB